MPKISTVDMWAELDNRVLAALDPVQPRTAGELCPGVPLKHVRVALDQHVRAGRATAHRDASRTTYTRAA